jgi:hypothetical protein
MSECLHRDLDSAIVEAIEDALQLFCDGACCDNSEEREVIAMTALAAVKRALRACSEGKVE